MQLWVSLLRGGGLPVVRFLGRRTILYHQCDIGAPSTSRCNRVHGDGNASWAMMQHALCRVRRCIYIYSLNSFISCSLIYFLFLHQEEFEINYYLGSLPVEFPSNETVTWWTFARRPVKHRNWGSFWSKRRCRCRNLPAFAASTSGNGRLRCQPGIQSDMRLDFDGSTCSEIFSISGQGCYHFLANVAVEL